MRVNVTEGGGHSGDGYDLAPTLFVPSMGKGGGGDYLFRADNVWWRCTCILLLPLVARCLETIDLCIWRMVVFMSVVVTGGGGRSVGIFVVVVDLPLLRVAVEGSDNPISLEKHCQAYLPPNQQWHHSLGRHPEVQYAVLRYIGVCR